MNSLYGVARQLTPSPADAEDLLQDTIVKAYSAYHSFQTGTHLRAWLIRIMRNTWIDQHRRRQRRPTEWLTENVDDWEFLADGRHSRFEHDTMDTSEIRRAFHRLPDTLRRALYFAYIEGRPYKEIAQLERIPLGTVMSRVHRARRQLRASLAHLEFGVPRSVVTDMTEERADLAS